MTPINTKYETNSGVIFIKGVVINREMKSEISSLQFHLHLFNGNQEQFEL